MKARIERTEDADAGSSGPTVERSGEPPGSQLIRSELARAVREASAQFGGDRGRVLLAVSGGRDSMTMLHVATAVARDAISAVATFDHGTGAHAARAAALVRSTAGALGVPVVSGTAVHVGRTEAEWRAARWAFLDATARATGAVAVATAHTRDDQRETVLMRALRGASARGVAALASRGTRVRPLLACSRAEVAAYAAEHGVSFVEDPANGARQHLRVRVRRDLLPALARHRPALDADLEAAGRRAAEWRTAVEQWAIEVSGAGAVRVDALGGCSPEVLAMFWPAFAALARVRLDRRAIARLVAFTAATQRRIHDGTVQPARVPVASGSSEEAEILLRHARLPGSGWLFAVRVAERGPVGVAAPRSSDYA